MIPHLWGAIGSGDKESACGQGPLRRAVGPGVTSRLAARNEPNARGEETSRMAHSDLAAPETLLLSRRRQEPGIPPGCRASQPDRWASLLNRLSRAVASGPIDASSGDSH